MIRHSTILPALFCAISLAACGGGSSPDATDNTIELTDPNSTATSDLNGVLGTVGGTGVSREAGSLNRATGAADLGSLSGTYDPTTGILSLDGGGTVTFGLEGDFASGLLVETTAGTQFGVVGVLGSNIPTAGSANYAGDSSVLIVDGQATYELEGTSTIDVVFDNDQATVLMDNLDGDRTDGTGAVTAVTDVAQIEISGVGVTGDALNGGFIDITSNTVTTTQSAQATFDHAGSIFGPDGDEVGGAFTLDDTTAGSLQVQGAYVGD